MKFRFPLNISMGFLLSCTTIFMPFVHAEDYVTKSQVNVASGVAGLNENKQVTADVKNAQTITQSLRINSGLLAPRATFFENTVWPLASNDPLIGNDRASSPRTIHFGGLEDHSDAYLSIIGNTMGLQDNGGAILSVQDVDTKYTSNRNGAGATDAVVQFNKTVNSGPRLKAGAEIANSDGKKRTVIITQTGFEVSPAFTEEQMKTIRGSGRIRVYSNWKHGNILSNDTLVGLDDPTKGLHGLDNTNVYFGYLDPDEAVTNESRSKTTFKVYYDNYGDDLGWRTSYNPNPAAKKNGYDWDQNIAQKAPGLNDSTIVNQKINGAPCSKADNTTCFATTIKDTIDNIKDGDTNVFTKGLVWSYSTPAVFIGMADKKFIHNDAAYYHPGDVNSKNEVERNQVDSITHSMVGVEYDLEAYPDHDYQYQIHGIMVDANGHDHKLTSDSKDMYLGGDINHHLVIGDACNIVGKSDKDTQDTQDRPATPEEMNYAIETSGFSVMAPCPTRAPNSGYNMAVFRGTTIKGERVGISIANLAKDKPNDKDALKPKIGLAGIKWKQDDDTGSISLCGGTLAKNCGLTVAGNGDIKITGNFANPLLLSSAAYDKQTTMVSGQGAVMMWNTVVSGGARTELMNVDPTGGHGGFDFFNINTTNTTSDKEPLLRLTKYGTYFSVPVLFKQNLNVAQQVSATQFHGQLSTPSSSSAACSAGDFKDDANYHYVCVATNKWKRVALSDF